MKSGQVMFIAGLLLLLIVVAGSQSRIPAQQTATTKTQVISYTYTTTTSVSGTVTTTTSTSATTVTSIQQTTTSVTTSQPTTTSSSTSQSTSSSSSSSTSQQCFLAIFCPSTSTTTATSSSTSQSTSSSSSSQSAGTPSSITIQISLPQAPQTGLTQSQVASLTVTVSGRVLDQYGNGVPNVYVYAFGGEFTAFSPKKYPDSVGYRPNFLNINPAQTDANGNFVLSVPIMSLHDSAGKIGVYTSVGSGFDAYYLFSDIYQISMNVIPEKNLYALFVDPYNSNQIDIDAYSQKVIAWTDLMPNLNYPNSPSIGTGWYGVCQFSTPSLNINVYPSDGSVAVGVYPPYYNGGTMIWNFCDNTGVTFKNIVIQTGINPWSQTNPTYPVFYDQNGNQQTPLFDLTSASLSKVKSGGTQQFISLSLISWSDNPLGIGIPTAEIFLILAFLLMISGALAMYRDREI